MAKIKYVRISTKEQSPARQTQDQSLFDKLFIDQASGKNSDRPALKQMMDYVRQGDTVVVESYSRFARNTKDLLELIDQLSAKGVCFISQKEQIDTRTPQGRLMLTIFAGLATFEREQLLQRQAEGIQIAKAQGKYKGRAPIQVPQESFRKVFIAWKAGKTTAREAMQMLGLKPNTFYRRVKQYEKSAIEEK